jgi:hypothetical protein
LLTSTKAPQSLLALRTESERSTRTDWRDAAHDLILVARNRERLDSLARVGARRWLARIAITRGLLTCAMLFVRTLTQFYAARFLLGVAEAGLFPGVIY